jgi:HNH endonuclease
VTRDGRILDPEVAEAVKIRIGMVLGGGYPKAARRLSDDERAVIFSRDQHRCRVCGEPATQIDHINDDPEFVATDINHPDNLQAICDRCHRAKTLALFRPAGPEEREKGLLLRERIDAVEPLRACDDEQGWQHMWRKLGSERSALVKAMQAEP